MKLFLAAVALTASFALPGHGEIIIGSGAASSCGRWLDDRQHDRHWQMANWALGFISGAAIWGDSVGDPLASTDSDGVFYWLDNYCKTHPSVYFHKAAEEFVRTHRG